MLSYVFESFSSIGDICHEGAFLALPNTDLPEWNVLGQDFRDDGDEIDDDNNGDEEEEEEEQGNVQEHDSWAEPRITYEEFVVEMETARRALEAKLASERSMWEHLVREDDDVEETELEEKEDRDEVEAGMVDEADVDVADMSMLSYYYRDESSLSINFDADASLIRDCDFEAEVEVALAYEADLEDFEEDDAWGFEGLSMA
ncbi:hypothetical protein OE88DRAFT_1665455 [Heliocybe sulcata]|uniref:Uncharacterized protein n=1 Tax=Heliocybe sulcata TaxID=5364 RepID=A0A5C3MTN6_9AGAM|nr:hypothetical protein OE88DRAFT_1665455 [Heliocybe sulcata]